jgi:hypothetical protein
MNVLWDFPLAQSFHNETVRLNLLAASQDRSMLGRQLAIILLKALVTPSLILLSLTVRLATIQERSRHFLAHLLPPHVMRRCRLCR